VRYTWRAVRSRQRILRCRSVPWCASRASESLRAWRRHFLCRRRL